MATRELPTTVLGWHGYIKYRVSHRPIPPVLTDILNPNGYADTENLKPERVGLAAIIAVRAYQRAKKILLAQQDTLSFRPAKSLNPVENLRDKSKAVSSAFTEAFAIGLWRDEDFVYSLSSDDKRFQIYNRLNELMDPAMESGRMYQEYKIIPGTGKHISEATGAFTEVFNASLPSQMLWMGWLAES